MDKPDTTFPIIPAKDLAIIVNSWDFTHISEEDLIKPSASLVQSIYCTLLAQIMGIEMSHLEGHRDAILEGVEFREYYLDAMVLEIVHHHLAHLCAAAKVDSYVLQDLTRPESARTRKILSGFHNFMLHRHERLPVTDKYLTDFDNAVEKELQLDYEIEEKKRRIKELKKVRKADIPLTEELGRKFEGAMESLSDIVHRIKEQVDIYTELRKHKHILVERLTSLQVEIQEIGQTNASMANRIVQSPERLKQRIVDMGSSAEVERTTLLNNENKTRALQGKLNQLGILEQEVHAILDLAGGIDVELTKLSETKNRLRDKRLEMDKKIVDSRELHTQTEQLDRQIANAKDRLDRVEKHGQEKREASRQKIDSLRSRYEEIAAERKEKDKEQQLLQRQIGEMESKIAEYIKEQQADLNRLLAENWELRKTVVNYMDTLSTKLALNLPTSGAGAKKQNLKRKKLRA